MDRGVVQRWLRQVLEPYAARERIASDVDRALTAFPTLRPRTDVYTYDDGRAALLLVLDGTLPVEYAGTLYYIPVHVWIPRAYADDPPIVYVVPTPAMLVRRSERVDVSGRVSPAYLDDWRRKPEGADLVELLRACQALFHTTPPVVAKPPSVDARAPPPARPPRPARPADAPGRPPVPGRPHAPRAAAPAPAPAPAPAAPARPMNPELRALHDAVHTRVAARRAELRDTLATANAQLRDLLADLQQGRPAIDDEMRRLEAVQAVCRTHTARLGETMRTAQQRIDTLQRRPDPHVDEMLVATSLVENQYVAHSPRRLQLRAEDAALEDTMYQLGRALHAEQLSLDRFIKQTRMLAREQFLRRALAKKIDAGLSTAT
ncbi:suppressor protein stp22 of temperature-sensitive alpha-factor receptor and arginine permease [Malassezia brasiliensis]|uniref:Suppressor protein stp22 of temperature-sensitive alpha-factor receptor and arginine permease n=1 Tax=Malassezia brasiliensis TaxID=1821822 RepID=A0AAF0DV77_9BASI|nr:suppressor protein stp22 of temperature-sensitive alpha-factor receptor and arginine permease [Malassezia brasiliensis]